jgi:septum formation topological specificity factor MinE
MSVELIMIDNFMDREIKGIGKKRLKLVCVHERHEDMETRTGVSRRTNR